MWIGIRINTQKKIKVKKKIRRRTYVRNIIFAYGKPIIEQNEQRGIFYFPKRFISDTCRIRVRNVFLDVILPDT